MSLSLTEDSSLDSVTERNCTSLARELRDKGVPLLRVSRNYNTKKVLMSFCPAGDGLHYEPAAEKRSTLRFCDIWAIRTLPAADKLCSKAGLKHFQYCIQVESQFGWSWNLVCATEMDRTTWVDFLEQRRRASQSESRANAATASIARYWSMAAQEGRQKLSFNEIAVVVKKLIGRVPAEEFANRFRQCDGDSDACLDYEEFREFLRYFNEAKAVRQIYERQTADSAAGMTAEEFTRFCMANDADSTMSPIKCAGLFRLFASQPPDRMDVSAFTAFLLHPYHNSAIDARQQRLVDPMDLPLPQYFISTSHNTYLTGNQLNSESSCKMYQEVLQAGCRCVEIDCWDGRDGHPVVYHGRTMTSKIAFADVIRTINEYAFAPPNDAPDGAWNPREFPVILSLEVHTSAEQTNRITAVMRDAFGTRLHLPTPDVSMYTPARLKGKILVKWRMNAAGVDDVKDTTGSGIREDRRAPLPTTLDLSACASIGPVRSSSWGADEQPFNVQSYVESDVARLAACAPVNYMRQNSLMLSRTYPAGRRIDSSNYDPMPMWELGCQLVALNWQTRDQHLRVNEGFFTHQNGGCGYVLKPTYMRDVNSAAVGGTAFTVAVRIICGSHLGTMFDGVSATHVSVRVWLHGESTSYETVTAPVAIILQWNESTSLAGRCRDTAVLCVGVEARGGGSGSHDIGTACIPVRVLRSGFHAMPLRHVNSGRVADMASLLCHISFSTPAPSLASITPST